jgi:ribosomal protein L28
MSRVCEICGKTYQKGNLVHRGIGNRVSRRTINRKSVNLRVKRFLINGVKVKFRLCASCLKKIVKEERVLLAAAANKQQEDIKSHLATAR